MDGIEEDAVELPTLDDLVEAGTLDPYQRYQVGLSKADLYPERDDNLCACGCGAELTGRRRRWASDACSVRTLRRFLVVKGDPRVIRAELWKREEGVCEECSEPVPWDDWEAHHRTPVAEGGGACDLDGYALLCSDCHKDQHRPETRDPHQLTLDP